METQSRLLPSPERVAGHRRGTQGHPSPGRAAWKQQSQIVDQKNARPSVDGGKVSPSNIRSGAAAADFAMRQQVGQDSLGSVHPLAALLFFFSSVGD